MAPASKQQMTARGIRQLPAWLLSLLVYFFYLGLMQPSFAVETAATPVRIGVLAFRPKPEMLARWQPLIDYLNAQIPSQHFELRTLTYGEFPQAIQEHGIDFALTQPAHYIELTRREKLSSPLATLVEINGELTLSNFGGVIATQAQRQDIQQLADLKGKRIATSSIHSLGSYQMQAGEFLDQGIDLARDITVIETGQPQDLAIQELLANKVDAAFVRSGVIEAMQREHKLAPDSLRILNRQTPDAFPLALSTRLYPEWPLAAMPWVEGNLARAVTSTVLGLPHQSPITAAIGIAGFNIPGDYRPVEELLRKLHLPPFEQSPKVSLTEIWAQYAPVIAMATMSGMALLLLGIFSLQRSNQRLEAERRRSADALARLTTAETHQRLTLSALGEGVFGTNLKGICTFVNPAALAILGYRENDLLGKNQHLIFHAFHPDGRHYPSEDCPIFQTASDGQTRRLDDWFWRSNGEGFPVRMTVTPILRDGQIEGTVVAFADISDAVRTQKELDHYRSHLEEQVQLRTEQLEEARLAAEASNRAKSAFLANMSHEIRTPLNAVIGMTHLLRREQPTPSQLERLQKIDHAAQHLLGVISDILDISKIEAGKLSLDLGPVNIPTLLSQIESVIGDRIREKGLRFSIASDVFPDKLLSDPVRIRQCLINYTGNALKFTEHGHITLRAILETRDETSVTARFEVEDSGIGIATNDIERLFDVFEQADNSTTRKYGGTGLGLAITRRLAGMLGGQIGVRSLPGQGSCFWFTAVLRYPEASQTSFADPPEATTHSTSLHGYRILIVEDEPINQEIVATLLADEGMAIVLADNGHDACARMAEGTFDIVLMDMQMPGMDGLEATRRIRATPAGQQVPIIAMTANAFAEDRQRCLEAGMNDFIVKPYDPEFLLSTLRKHLARPSAKDDSPHGKPV